MKQIFVLFFFIQLIIYTSCSRPETVIETNNSSFPPTDNHVSPDTILTTSATVEANGTESTITEPPMTTPAITETPENIISVLPEDSYTAKSGSAADIQAAIDMASITDGGNVYIPEGEYDLNGVVNLRSNIKLIGAGKGKTILRTQGQSMMIIAKGNNIRISGFSLIADDSDGGNGIVIEDCIDFRVDHMQIEGYSGQAAVFVSGRDTRGVIDHCDIKMKPVANLGYGVVVYGDDTWKDDAQLGTQDAVFIEDNTFINTRHAVAANKGAHYVFRYNLVEKNVREHAVDAHGPYWGSRVGTQMVEIYNNTIVDPEANGNERAIGIRGGGGVIFNNVIRGYIYAVMLIIEEGQDLKSYPVFHQVHDLYIWNNSFDGEQEIIIQRENRATQFIKENRDFFIYPKDGYKPFTYPHPLTLS